MAMRIGELAKISGCQAVTIRYYEREGLLAPSGRTGVNYRTYGEAEIERLRFIRHCRLLGMNLSEIRDLLAFQDDPVRDCDWIDQLVDRHIRDVNEQIASLERLREHLEELRCKCNGGRHNSDCGILRELHENCGCDFCARIDCRHKHGAGGCASDAHEEERSCGDEAVGTAGAARVRKARTRA